VYEPHGWWLIKQILKSFYLFRPIELIEYHQLRRFSIRPRWIARLWWYRRVCVIRISFFEFSVAFFERYLTLAFFVPLKSFVQHVPLVGLVGISFFCSAHWWSLLWRRMCTGRICFLRTDREELRSHA
jgi:hypothetical protein